MRTCTLVLTDRDSLVCIGDFYLILFLPIISHSPVAFYSLDFGPLLRRGTLPCQESTDTIQGPREQRLFRDLGLNLRCGPPSPPRLERSTGGEDFPSSMFFVEP